MEQQIISITKSDWEQFVSEEQIGLNLHRKTGLLLEHSDTPAGVNQILPHRHPEVWEMYKEANANTWTPQEVNMTTDSVQWQSPEALSEDERRMVIRNLGFFACGESLVSNNLLLTIFRYITDPECRQYILRQANEEAIHNWTVITACETFGLKVEEVYESYINIPSIHAKEAFLESITTDLSRLDFDISTIKGKQEFLKALVTFYIICEGILFFSGFVMLLSLGRQNKLRGLSEQIRYTLRDETVHVKFGTYLINTIKEQYPEVWTEELQYELIDQIKTATLLEIQYAHDVLPNGLLGLNAEMFIQYMQYLANRRMSSIGLNAKFSNDRNPFDWLNAIVEIVPMTNFFERRVQDYANRGVLEDDF